MIDVPVSSVVTDAPPTVPPATSLVDVASHLRDPEVPAVIVVDEGEELVGIVAESDVVAAVAERVTTTTASSIMSSPVIAVEPETPIGLAADRMQASGVTRLAIVDSTGSYQGLVTLESLAPYLSRHRLDIEWTNEPLSLSDPDGSEATAVD
jgi:CBS domain-containing protein